MRFLLTLALLFAVPFFLPTQSLNAATAVASGEIVGQVFDTHRQPVADATVAIRMTHRSGRTFTLRTHTDRSGKFHFPRVPESVGVIGAAKRGVGRDRARVGVHGGETTHVRLQLQ
jgi:Carboxypeptidase regulatory-like domain